MPGISQSSQKDFSMKSRSFFGVGDKFQEFAKGKDVLTMNQLKALTRLPHRLLNTHSVLMLGQGAQEDEVFAFVHSVEASPELSPRFELSDLQRVLDRAAPSASHKRIAHNTVIGAPARKSADTFEVPLNLDERCELMGDRQTGQHVQGMLLVEAFRQSFLAVTDTYFPLGQSKTCFVINTMHVEFLNFLFPLPAHIEYRIVEADVSGRRARYKTTMCAVQNGAQCASAVIGFTVYPAETIAQKEAELAALLTQTMLAAALRQSVLAVADSPAPQPQVDVEVESAA